MKKLNLFKLSIVLLVLVVALSCTIVGAAPKRLRVINVPKFTGFIFFELAKQGAKKACDELGADLVYVGTTTADTEGQVQVLQNLVAQKPDCIVLASLDLNAPVPVLSKMRSQGTVVVTYDSDVAPAGRDLFTNMAPFNIQAKAMLEAALVNNPNGGKVIWLAPTATTANFISQKKALDDLIASTPKYQSIKFIDTLYMNDDPEQSYKVASSAMEAHPDLAGFISGSGMAVPAVNKAIQDTGRVGKVFATGFALPSTMKTYYDAGVCKESPLWSPYWFGYMATYSAIKIKRGEWKAKDGTKINIPNVGSRVMYSTPTGLNADLNMMMFFTKGHDDFDTAIPMK
jgi:rhamnose transport system substrate-binding protein